MKVSITHPQGVEEYTGEMTSAALLNKVEEVREGSEGRVLAIIDGSLVEDHHIPLFFTKDYMEWSEQASSPQKLN